ncbi:hypothetical protein U4E84_13290 [Halorubrum sp. AD140]|uniref:HEAT repeat domain-containing protein n=1 Tax=Halorubrum sp. AD140 TaxID=3050073 RepID=UPI002ACC6233|nr:HEAT repeat domain-containing protein [Halorubrum sp. AD140]MDZ5812317.1 hypothetical protein [Halorubrum sp. AD140]
MTPSSPDRLVALLTEDATAEAVAWLDGLETADAETRRRALRQARSHAAERPDRFDGLADSLAPFLTDTNRAVRLTTAKLFVALARAEPSVTRPAVAALADRLADDGEFYYVRARCAEALGYVALEHPETVGDPETLADLRIGLSFDEPEVKPKLAKALECVALGDPSRLRHQVGSLAEHLDDDDELVRYHLCTALAAVGCAHPAKLAAGRDALAARLSDPDEDPRVRGRAAEALGLLCRAADEAATVPDEVGGKAGEAEEFLAPRLAFLRAARTGSSTDRTTGVGTLGSLRDGSQGAVDEMTTPEGDECPGCGLSLPDDGPPTCPRCGSPY